METKTIIEQVKQTIIQANDVFMNAKKELFDNFIDNDGELVTIGTWPDEIIVWSENLMQALVDQHENIDNFFTKINEIKIKIIGENKVALFYAKVHMHWEFDWKIFDYTDCRLTWALELIDWKWRIKQLHYSVWKPL